eukprot:CAMPEP_0175440236 /NCGR_PEP_ID=MMETSP0095-20121207/56960_1 /TAXON_ID=311494 /ORGANISM="Alexandrium monilatum, Strain CCMP3105" /LENGTH=90 /DNA_ID=CAMNT_0016740091 /DNA_START=258 /DNA_END=526 /DNA_ORIENTATION=+
MDRIEAERGAAAPRAPTIRCCTGEPLRIVAMPPVRTAGAPCGGPLACGLLPRGLIAGCCWYPPGYGPACKAPDEIRTLRGGGSDGAPGAG